ncbi:SGNH/GDSL hydrolase family protein [Litoreibacter roseus]|uniref:VPLPA-CTERM protein sorting domain-containing protein n=1 Tax=Litoreibacter roseus TaxID=2601869 RepID=A0A6N6JLL5_9RHOB|nr:SGNH/GDSL hydrolase family protein [Litoreibacter roseus]GFE66299.1 hypothetical protein KIN_33730 [Litoreibacter roseus]
MKTTLITLSAALALTASAQASTLTDTYTGFYSFGDSLSDDGKGVAPALLPYFEGRFSNGLVWAEVIEDEFSDAGVQTANFALGGATAQGGDNEIPFARLSTFSGQIGTFEDLDDLGLIDAGDNPLTSVWFGANDVFAALGAASPTLLQDARDAADAVTEGVREIANDSGFLFDDFVIVSLPNLASTPAFAGIAAAAAVTEAFNSQLATNITGLEADGINVFSYDSNILFDAALNGELGYAVTDIPCYIEDVFNCSPDSVEGADPYLFIDGVHPTRTAHFSIAEGVSAQITGELTPVPLPATAPMILVAFAGLALVTRRRKA